MFKKFVKKILRSYAGVTVFRKLPRGVDEFQDIEKRLVNTKISTIFDVGAYDGRSAVRYLERFPNARITSFEPCLASFRRLVKNLGARANISLINAAVSSEPGRAVLEVSSHPDRNRLSNYSNLGLDAVGVEDVNVVSLDTFCDENDVGQIDYLKVDSEGHELDVLSGSSELLRTKRIKIVELELGMNPKNERHVSFSLGAQRMIEYEYYLFGIYGQTEEWPTRDPRLRRANCVFISEDVARDNKIGYLRK